MNSNVPGTITGSLSARADVRLWAQAAFRAYLWRESLAYGQVGLRPALIGDLWGYTGNNCGDANGDGVNEPVSAVTFDMDWQVSAAKILDIPFTEQRHLAHVGPILSRRSSAPAR